MKDLIQKLVETPGPSGYENQIRAAIRSEIEPLVDEFRIDNLGNLIARKGQVREGGCRIMLSAHMDEIGVMASHIDDRGFVRFMPIGGVSPYTLPGSRVLFVNGTSGVIGMEVPDDPGKTPALDHMYIDVGASSREDAPVRVGDAAVFDRPFTTMGKHMVSKAMDDRISVAVLIETLRRLDETPHEIFSVFSTQEEVGLRGATTAAFGVDPDLGLAIDVTRAGDTPKGPRIEVALGKGPAIKVRDQGMLSDPRVVRWMVEAAEGAGLPYQLEVLTGGTTDAKSIQLTRSGVPAGCLSIPCRYIHSPSEMVDADDVENAVRLLVELLHRPAVLGDW